MVVLHNSFEAASLTTYAVGATGEFLGRSQAILPVKAEEVIRMFVTAVGFKLAIKVTAAL